MTNIFTGLSAFPLTPLNDDKIDERALTGLVERLAAAGVDSITALGSTGSYAYLTTEERARVARLAVEHAGDTPVIVGVGALRTSQVLANAEAAHAAGAAGLLLAPMTYQPLTHDDVFELFRAVTAASDLPVILYDNPGTTHFEFTNALYSRCAELPGIASIKIPGVPADSEAAREHVAAIRAVIPELLAHASGQPGWVAGLLGASITPRTCSARSSPAASTPPATGGRSSLPPLAHGTLLGLAGLLLPVSWAIVPALLLIVSGLFGPKLTGGVSSRLPSIAGPSQTSQRRAQSWDVASYGISGTLGPAAVAWLAAAAGPLVATPDPGGRSDHRGRGRARPPATCPMR